MSRNKDAITVRVVGERYLKKKRNVFVDFFRFRKDI